MREHHSEAFVEKDARLGVAQWSRRLRLAVEQGATAQILVLDKADRVRSRAVRSRPQAQFLKSRQAIGPQHDGLAVDHEALGP
jgi:hypothetical protein